MQVIEIAPPLTRTTLMGSNTDNDRAMPLDAFAPEAMRLLQSQPDARQILVERVKRQRFAEANGTYDEILTMQANLSLAIARGETMQLRWHRVGHLPERPVAGD